MVDLDTKTIRKLFVEQVQMMTKKSPLRLERLSV